MNGSLANIEKVGELTSQQIADFFMQEIKELLVYDIEHNPVYKGVSLNTLENTDKGRSCNEFVYNMSFDVSECSTKEDRKRLSYLGGVRITITPSGIRMQNIDHSIIEDFNGKNIVDCYYKLRNVIVDRISNLKKGYQKSVDYKVWLMSNVEKILKAQKP